jgi:hemerythrin-like domain-containing protein
MGPFEVLSQEHEQILRALELLDRASHLIAEGSEVPVDALADLVSFFRRFGDACHHAKEEQVLFPALEQAGMARNQGPIGVMLAEHVEGRALVSRISDLLDEGGDARPALAEAARSFSLLLQDHIRKEEEVLYPIGRSRVPPDRDAEILAAYDKMEASVISPEDKAALLSSLDRIERALA